MTRLNRILFPNLPLRTRLTIGLFCMLVPLMIVIAATFFSQNEIIENLDEIVEESTEEIGPLLRIQNALYEMMMPVHDFLITGNRQEEEALFEQRAQRVDEAFMKALSGPFALKEETEKVQAAFLEWQEARRTGKEIFSLSGVPGSTAGVAAMEEFDRHMSETISPLAAFYSHANEEIIVAEAAVARIKNHTHIFIGVMLVLGTGLALLTAIVLTKSILAPVQALKRGASLLGEGDLLHRVELSSSDEFGTLARAFNSMAQKLEVSHRHLQELSFRDELTGLNNRRRFIDDLQAEVSRSRRYEHPFALMLIDLDHFKTINDSYGHPVGDAVLQQVAEALHCVVRSCDSVARIGGEEFAVIMTEAGLAEAEETAERIRHAITAQVSIEADTGYRVTASIGLAVFPEHAAGQDDLFQAADQALYQAKEQGRNQVFPFSCAWLDKAENSPRQASSK